VRTRSNGEMDCADPILRDLAMTSAFPRLFAHAKR